jgi:hypothetical protein
MKASAGVMHHAVGLCLIAVALAWSPVQATTDNPSAKLVLDGPTQALFAEGWAAASVGDAARLNDALDRLTAHAPDSPLLVYLRFEQLRQSVGEVDADTMTRFLATHRHWSFADRLQRTWLRSLVRRGEVARVDQYLQQTDQQATDAELACALVSRCGRWRARNTMPAIVLLGGGAGRACPPSRWLGRGL